MVQQARAAAVEAGVQHVACRAGYAEALPVPDRWADVVISHGVVNLCPDKWAVLQEMSRVLTPGGRLQIGDILVPHAVPEAAKEHVERGPVALPGRCWTQRVRRPSRPLVSRGLR